MATFLSGTDIDTLRDEGAERHNFVSLIVNNAGNYTAAITRRVQHVKKIEDCYNYKFFGEGEVSNCAEYETTDTEVEYFNLNIDKESEDYSSLEKRIKELKTNNSQNKMSFSTLPTLKETALKTWNDFTNNEVTKPIDMMESEEVDKIVCQILTGCVVVDKNNINLNTFVPRMQNIYSKRFENMEDFMLWADSYCEYLLWYSDEVKANGGEEPSEACAVLAAKVLDKLSEYPSNDYLAGYMETLNNFINI